MTKTDHLFVYGTLMASVENDFAALLRANGRHVGPAEFLGGRLYRVSWYPALVETSDVTEVVHGDLFELNESISDHIEALDHYEGIGPQFSQPYEYRRENRTVVAGDQEYSAWVYLYNWEVDEAKRVPSGRFRG